MGSLSCREVFWKAWDGHGSCLCHGHDQGPGGSCEGKSLMGEAVSGHTVPVVCHVVERAEGRERRPWYKSREEACSDVRLAASVDFVLLASIAHQTSQKGYCLRKCYMGGDTCTVMLSSRRLIRFCARSLSTHGYQEKKKYIRSDHQIRSAQTKNKQLTDRGVAPPGTSGLRTRSVSRPGDKLTARRYPSCPP